MVSIHINRSELTPLIPFKSLIDHSAAPGVHGEAMSDHSAHVQHMRKVLEQINVKLAEVVSSITGVTGSAIIEAILRGERDPKRLAALRHERCARSEDAIARALEGTWRAEHLFALKHAFELNQDLHRQIDECDRRIADELDRLPDRRDDAEVALRPRRRGRKPNDARFDAAAKLARALGVDLTAIEGVDAATATVILAETGGDMGRFPTRSTSPAGWGSARGPTGDTRPSVAARRARARGGWRRRCG